LVRVADDPVHVALGFALGVFIGVFPTFGIGIPVALFLAALFRWNKAAALTGTLLMNPLTTPFFWSLSGTVGALMFRTDTKFVLRSFRDGEGLKSLSEGALIYLAGNTVVALLGRGRLSAGGSGGEVLPARKGEAPGAWEHCRVNFNETVRLDQELVKLL